MNSNKHFLEEQSVASVCYRDGLDDSGREKLKARNEMLSIPTWRGCVNVEAMLGFKYNWGQSYYSEDPFEISSPKIGTLEPQGRP